MGTNHVNGDGSSIRRLIHSWDRPEATGGEVRELADLLLDLGARAQRRGELQSALDLFANATRAQPDSAWAWYNYGNVLLVLKRYEEAVSSLSKAIQLSPGTALFHYDLGLALFKLHRHDEARQEFAGIVAIDPQLQRASSMLGLAALTSAALTQDSRERAQKAGHTLEPALQTAIDTLYSLGRFNLDVKRAGQAIGFLRAAALLAPESKDILHALGRTLMDLKGESEALPLLVKSSELNPLWTDAWYDLGVTLGRLKERKKARACFIKVLDLDPNYAWAYYDLACLDALERKPTAAFQNLENAVARGFHETQYIRRDADFVSLRKDARWSAILAKIDGLAEGPV
jgi:tetratricopeptide (TPR) repeat protein